jgi:predicted HNH restriction endonuclease
MTAHSLPDLDIHLPAGMEGEKRLKLHLFRERNRSLIKLKKKSASSLDCEVCGFSFRRTYGRFALDYCEVHHLVPLAKLESATLIKVEDLAILCANCHRVIHLRCKPEPYSLQEVREMLLSSAAVRSRSKK